MLYGTIKYRDDHLGEMTYTVYGRDSFDDTKLYIINDDIDYTKYDQQNYLFDKQRGENPEEYYNLFPDGVVVCDGKDGEVVLPVPDKRRLDVKKTNKYKSNITNREFCVRVSALIRYMQISGKKNYNQNHDDMEYSNVREVKVESLGVITYNMGLITDLVCENKYVSLELHTVPDEAFEIAIFKDIKEKDKYGNILSATPVEIVGFKLTGESLGFPYVPPIKKEFVNVLGVFDNIEDVIANNPDKNTDWILSRKYVMVTDDILEEVFQMFMNHDGLIAFDTETTGLNINFKSRTGDADQLVGCVLSMEKGTGYYFPLQHKLFDNLCDGDHWYFMDKYMRPILENKQIICHNAIFDWKVAYIYDINTNVVYDTMIAFGVTKRYEEESYELGLKALAKNILGLDMFDLDDFVTGSTFSDSNITFADLPYELVRRYAPADADVTLSLYEFLEKEQILNKYEAHRIFEMEVVFAKAAAYSEFYGYHIEVDKVPELQARIEENMEKYKQEMFDMAGKEFNPRSQPQLIKVMYDELYPDLKKEWEDQGKKLSTDKETLGALKDYTDANGDPKYPFAIALKNYRDNEGIYKNFLKKLNEFCTHDGYIFPSIMQLGTNTGRLSIKNPNYQSYNDIVKRYVTPRPGFIHVDSDFAQIEYRVLASMAKQENLIKEFDDPDLDYHTYQAARMFGVPYAAVTKPLRQQSKGVNFGLPYGMGDSSLGARIYGERTPENTRKAANLRRKFFQGQEKIQNFFEVVRSQGVAKGYTSTHFGRRRYYHKGVFSVNEIRRQAGNHVIQGTAADIYKLAVVRLFRRICKEGWLGKVLFNAFVHDELLMEVHKSINPYYFFKAWREEFEVTIEGFCRLFAGLGVGHCWYDAKKLDLPPQYTDELIAKWHEDLEWDEDFDKLIEDIKQGHKEYCIRRVKEFIVAPENQGQIIKPNISTLMFEIVSEIISEAKGNEAEIVRLDALVGSKGLVKIDGKHKLKDLQHLLKIFCDKHGVDYNTLDIRSPEEVSTQEQASAEDAPPQLVFEDVSRDELAFTLVQYSGAYADITNNVVYLSNIVTSAGVNIIDYCNRKGYFTHEGDYEVRMFLNPQDLKSLIVTNAKLTRENYALVKKTYGIFLRGVV